MYLNESTSYTYTSKGNFSQLDCTGGGVNINKHGQTVLEEYFGVQGQQYDAKRVGPHTLFHLASVHLYCLN